MTAAAQRGGLELGGAPYSETCIRLEAGAMLCCVGYAVHFVLFASAYKESHSSPDKEPLDTAPSLPGYLVLRPPDSLVALFVFRSQKNWKLRHKWFVLSPRGFLCLFVGGEKKR